MFGLRLPIVLEEAQHGQRPELEEQTQMMARKQALEALDALEAFGMNARRRANSEQDQWIECYSARTGRVTKTLRSAADVAQFMRWPNRDFVTIAAQFRAERAELEEVMRRGDVRA